MRVSYEGGRLSLPHSSVTLTVPQGALNKDTIEELYLGVQQDGPSLIGGETVISPVVCCGPQTVETSKPLIIDFPHWRSSGCGVSVYYRPTGDNSNNTPWKVNATNCITYRSSKRLGSEMFDPQNIFLVQKWMIYGSWSHYFWHH